jgi:hypothetical protein
VFSALGRTRLPSFSPLPSLLAIEVASLFAVVLLPFVVVIVVAVAAAVDGRPCSPPRALTSFIVARLSTSPPPFLRHVHSSTSCVVVVAGRRSTDWSKCAWLLCSLSVCCVLSSHRLCCSVVVRLFVRSLVRLPIASLFTFASSTHLLPLLPQPPPLHHSPTNRPPHWSNNEKRPLLVSKLVVGSLCGTSWSLGRYFVAFVGFVVVPVAACSLLVCSLLDYSSAGCCLARASVCLVSVCTTIRFVARFYVAFRAPLIVRCMYPLFACVSPSSCCGICRTTVIIHCFCFFYWCTYAPVSCLWFLRALRWPGSLADEALFSGGGRE